MNSTPHSGGWSAIQAGPADEHILQELLLNSQAKHQHLDWFRSQELLDRPPFLFAYFDAEPQGGLACPPEPQDTAWLRLFFAIRGASPKDVWASIWPDARLSAIKQGTTKFAALIFDPWFRKILIDSDFSETNSVVFLEWEAVESSISSRNSVELRAMRPEDIETLTVVDNASFAQIWRHSATALSEGLKQSSYATVAAEGENIMGYQISTSSIFGAHLARLAVEPGYQRRGIATQMTLDLMSHFASRGFARVSVNTQIDNLASLRLYEKLGFVQTGQQYSVLTLDA